MVLTIVIPFYNIYFFEDCLISLKNQTVKNFNVIIGNDASPHNPEDIINKFKECLNIQYIYFENNLGKIDLTKHWARCIDEVKTEWFMILGDDDMLSDNAVEEFYKTEKTNNIFVLRFQTQVIINETKFGNINDYSAIKDCKIFQELNSQYKVRSSLGEYVFKKEQYLKYGIKNYKKGFYSDNWMFLNYAEFDKIESINAVSYIRISKNSLSGNKENREVIVVAGYLFHWDLIKLHGSHFNYRQKKVFLPYIIDGYIKNVIQEEKKIFFKTLLKNYNWIDFFIASLKIIKKLSKNKYIKANASKFNKF